MKTDLIIVARKKPGLLRDYIKHDDNTRIILVDVEASQPPPETCFDMEYIPLGLADYSQAVNTGLRATKSDYIIWGNDDVEVNGSFVEKLLGPIKENPMTITGLSKERQYGWRFMAGQLVGMHKNAIRDIGFLDEGFKGAFEDADYGARAYRHGYNLAQITVPVRHVCFGRFNHQLVKCKEFFLEKNGLGPSRWADPEVIVVLGNHRSGTSVTASILETLGVNMGERLLGKLKGNPLGHFEDLDFLNLSGRILKSVGAKWYRPPRNLSFVPDNLRQELKSLVRKKSEQGGLWGWKDPRTLALLELYKPILDEIYPERGQVRFVYTQRPRSDIEKSLSKRSGKKDWSYLLDYYEDNTNIKTPSFFVHFDQLTSARYARQVVSKLSDFVGRGNVDEAMKRIIFRCS